MADYIELLKQDLAEQFKEKPVIDALIEAIGTQLNDVCVFYGHLRDRRGIYTAVGKQLDGIGDIVVLSRMEAGILACVDKSVFVLNDERYRQYLLYKIWRNTNRCTYPDIIKAFRMFWDKPLYYREDPEQPATMIFDTGEMEGLVDTTPLFNTPLLRAAGVTLKLYARTKTPMPTTKLRLASGLGYAVTETSLPALERQYTFQSHMNLPSGVMTVSEDRLPNIE